MEQTIVTGRNNGYPCIPQLADISKLQQSSPPYPQYIMRCLGSGVNDGYPCIMSLAGAVMHTASRLYFGERPVTSMYLNGKSVRAGFCNGQRVFGVYYTAE